MASRERRESLLLAASLVIASGAGAQSPPVLPDAALERAAREVVEGESGAERFSGVVLLARGGVPIAEVAVGTADRERRTSVTVDTRFNLASGDKLFTKIAVLQLVQSRRVDLADTVGKFLPAYANESVRRSVTVEHLLRHRSGLGDYLGEMLQEGRNRAKELEDLVRLFEREEPAFAPGTRMRYSNSGYVLLGRIIEVASGLPYREYVQRNVFKPAGLSQTAYLTIEEWPADKAVGYTASDSLSALAGGGRTSNPPRRLEANQWSLAFRGSSAGGGYSTARDLLALDGALRRGAIVDAASLARFTVTGPDGSQLLANGGGPGANFEFVRAGEYTVVVLSNYDPPAATRVCGQVVGLLTGARGR